MRERMARIGKEAADQSVVEMISPNLKVRYEAEGLPGLADEAFRVMNARPLYIHEHDNDFEDSRERLNSEPGLIICNHPGFVDTPAVLKTLERPDVKFLVAEGAAEKLGKVLPKTMLLEASKDLGKLRILFKEIEKHIASGGSVFLYPSGGQEPEGKGIPFRGGFGAILKRIPAESMVYAFMVDPDDAKNVGNKGAAAYRLSSDVLVPDMVKSSLPQGKPKIIRIDEQYTQAAEWLDALQQSDLPRSKATQALQDHYLQLFETELTHPL